MVKYSDDFRAELKKGFLEAVGHMADYRIRLNAGGWVDKDVLTEEDFLEICNAIEAQHIEPPIVEDEVIEELIEDETLDGDVPSEDVIEEPAGEDASKELPEESTEQPEAVEPVEEPTE